LVIYDKGKGKLVKYQSSEEFDPKTVFRLTRSKTQNQMYEEYSNLDYKQICDNKTQTFTNFRREEDSNDERNDDNHLSGEEDAQSDDDIDSEEGISCQS